MSIWPYRGDVIVRQMFSSILADRSYQLLLETLLCSSVHLIHLKRPESQNLGFLSYRSS